MILAQSKLKIQPEPLKMKVLVTSDQIRSVAQSCLILCDPMNRSMPGLPVHHQLPEFTQTHVYRVSDAIQPSHPLSSPSPLAPNPSQHQSLFQWVNSSNEVAKVLGRWNLNCWTTRDVPVFLLMHGEKDLISPPQESLITHRTEGSRNLPPQAEVHQISGQVAKFYFLELEI